MKLIGLKDVLALTGFSKQTIYNKMKDGSFPVGVRVGGSRLWDEEWITVWLNTGDVVRPAATETGRQITVTGKAVWGGEAEIVKLHAKPLTMAHLDKIAGIRNRLAEANRMMDELVADLFIDNRDAAEKDIDDRFAAEDEALLKQLEGK